MKFANLFKFTILLVLVAFSLNRTEKKKSEANSESKSQSKSNSKSEAKMARQFTVNIFVDQDKNASVEPSVAVIDAKNVKVVKTEELQRNLPLTFTKLNDDLKNLLNQNNGQYSLAYRKLSTFNSQEVNKEGKIITTSFRKSPTEFSTLKIQFEFDPEWEIITDLEVNDLISWLNRNRQDIIDRINALKTLAIQYLVNYKTNTDNASAAASGAASIDAQIASLNQVAKQKQDELKLADTQANEKERTISSDQASIESLSQQLTSSKQKLDSLDAQIVAKDNILSQLNANLADKSMSAASFESSMNAKKIAFNNVIDNLKTEAPLERSLDTAFNVLDTQGTDKVEALLRTIFPK
jgi:hypothetical protein